MKRKKYLTGYFLIAPLFLGSLIFSGIPFGMTIYYSMKSSPGSMGRFVGFLNYNEVLGNELFRLACRNTLLFFMIGLPMNLVISYLIALLLKKQAEKYEIIRSFLVLPYIMPIVGTIFLIEEFFETYPDIQLSYGFWVILLLYLWKSVGYSVILLLSGLMSIPQSQYAVAELEGANAWQKFCLITTPQMWNTVFFTMMFALINGFKCFREIFLIGGKYPSRNLYMMQHFINNNFENLNYGKLSVTSVLIFVSVTLVMGLLYLWVQKKEAYKK